MRVIPAGYGNRQHAQLIPRLMQDTSYLLVDIRYAKASAIPGWHATSLEQKYGDRYVYLGRKLGNKHYKQPERGIEIVDLEDGLIDLLSLLQDYTCLLLCGCGTMEPSAQHPHGCHRRIVCDALVEWCSEVEVVTPEAIVAREQALLDAQTGREALYLELNHVQPALADYWQLSRSEQSLVRRGVRA